MIYTIQDDENLTVFMTLAYSDAHLFFYKTWFINDLKFLLPLYCQNSIKPLKISPKSEIK